MVKLVILSYNIRIYSILCRELNVSIFSVNLILTISSGFYKILNVILNVTATVTVGINDVNISFSDNNFLKLL